MSRKAERDAWTAFVDGKVEAKPNKYAAERSGKYASKHEADVAGKLATWQRIGAITELKEQVSFTLVEGQSPIRPIRYVADFTWMEGGKLHIGDAKGYTKNQVYRLKKKLMKLLLGLDIKEL
jgi:hypothetical protein